MYYMIVLNSKPVSDRDFRMHIYKFKEHAEKGIVELKRWNHDAKYEIVEIDSNVKTPVTE